LIDIPKLRTLLKFEGINLDDYTDDELTILAESKVNELAGLLGLDVNPVHRKQTVTDYKGEIIRLDFYPVYDFNKITVDGECLHPNRYHVDYRLGLVYLHDYIIGTVEIKYISGLPDDFMINTVNPLIKDMVTYSLTYNKLGMGGPVSSIKEGDVSVNYDTNNSLGNRITNQITDIKSRYASARVRWL
jgi:hypothetical protein